MTTPPETLAQHRTRALARIEEALAEWAQLTRQATADASNEGAMARSWPYPVPHDPPGVALRRAGDELTTALEAATAYLGRPATGPLVEPVRAVVAGAEDVLDELDATVARLGLAQADADRYAHVAGELVRAVDDARRVLNTERRTETAWRSRAVHAEEELAEVTKGLERLHLGRSRGTAMSKVSRAAWWREVRRRAHDRALSRLATNPSPFEETDDDA